MLRGNLRLKDKKLRTMIGIGKLHHKESITSLEEKDKKVFISELHSTFLPEYADNSGHKKSGPTLNCKI